MKLITFSPVQVTWKSVTNVQVGLFSSLKDLCQAAHDAVAHAGKVWTRVDDATHFRSRKIEIIIDPLVRDLSWFSSLILRVRFWFGNVVEKTFDKYVNDRFPGQSERMVVNGRRYWAIDEFPESDEVSRPPMLEGRLPARAKTTDDPPLSF